MSFHVLHLLSTSWHLTQTSYCPSLHVYCWDPLPSSCATQKLLSSSSTTPCVFISGPWTTFLQSPIPIISISQSQAKLLFYKIISNLTYNISHTTLSCQPLSSPSLSLIPFLTAELLPILVLLHPVLHSPLELPITGHKTFHIPSLFKRSIDQSHS